MNPFRLAIGAICALAVAIAWMGPDSEPTVTVAPTAIQTSIVALKPTPPTVTTTSIVTTTTVPPTTTTTFPWALIAADHVCEEWGPMMLEEGWPADREILETALGIMYRESRCQPVRRVRSVGAPESVDLEQAMIGAAVGVGLAA